MSSKEGKKLQFLKSIERPTKIKKTGIPLLVTFPYPYMNGKLHLGHLFTISKVEFFSRFAELHNFDVLFPFSFHCTGMPICASAQRLKENDFSVISSLKSMGITEVEKFTDPLHWVNTFPKFAKESLIKFNANITWDRSFVTTEYNKLYDTFIRWQFSKLSQLGLLSFGKRYTVYCTKTKQPCLDHDRLKGEGVLPKRVDLLKVLVNIKEGKIGLFLPYQMKNDSDFFRLFYNKKSKLVLVCTDFFFIVEEDVFNNLIHQVSDIKKIRDIQWDEIDLPKEEREFNLIVIGENVKTDSSDFKNHFSVKNESLSEESLLIDEMINNKQFFTLNQTENLISYFKTESEIISRSNTVCVVALLDQWFIDYSKIDWKVKAHRCLDNLITHKETKILLKDGMDWIGKWAFSRSFGIGTSFNEYVIDSLSDSTIYMSFYTFYHLLSDDLFGNTSFKVEEWMFDYIFKNVLSDELILEEKEIFCDCLSEKLKNLNLESKKKKCLKCTLDLCRSLLNNTYPVYLRVSGKDLIRNHLLFFILNHVALFKEEFWPKRIETNGHLLLNSNKMSKSTGNFLTVDDVISKFGESSTRMCLAMCGDTNEDADFMEVTANSTVLKLYSFIESVKEYFAQKESDLSTELSLEEKWLLENINRNIHETNLAYRNFVFRDVIKFGFHEMLNSYEKFLVLGGKKDSLVVKKLYESIVIILYPIIPSVSFYLNENFINTQFNWPEVKLTNEYIPAFEYLKKIQKRLTKLKNKSKVKIVIGKEFSEWKQKILSLCGKKEVKENDLLLDRTEVPQKNVDEETKQKFISVLEEYGIDQKIGMPFCVSVYLKGIDSFDEMDILIRNKRLLESACKCEVDVCYGESEPYDPKFIFE